MATVREIEKTYAGKTIIFGSDFGGDVDNLRATGSARKINPEVKVDSTARLKSCCVTSGATELEALARDYPPAIFVWVVDPGVGTDRKGLAIETHDGSVLIGPDNGLLLPAARITGIDRIWELNREAIRAKPFSIFDGRDLFMKAAGYLSKGATLKEIAQPISEDKITPLSFKPNQVVRIDGTGNVVLEHLCSNNYCPDKNSPDQTYFLLEGVDYLIPYVKSFDDVSLDDLGFLKGSIGERLWLFRNGKSAAEFLSIEVNHVLNISPVRTKLEEAILQRNYEKI